MILRQLEIRKLHGTLNLSVSFNEDVTMLVGINGCGKTSVLNVIDWLLKPNLKRLGLTSYSELVLIFDFQKTRYKLRAHKTPDQAILSIEAEGLNVAPITVDLIPTLDLDSDEAEDAYDGLGPEKHEIPMWSLLKSFTSPIVITLDRTISAESEETHFIEPSRNTPARRTRTRSPLAHVQDVTSARYAEYRAKAIQHDDELKAKIVMSALQDPETYFRGEAIKPMTKQEISNLESKVIKYLTDSIKSDNVAIQVRRFFSTSLLLAKRTKPATQDFLMDFLSAQYRQVENLAKAFNEFEVKNGLAFKELKDYLAAINKFFGDSNKTLYFDESTGKLVFAFTQTDGKKLGARKISCLSSGEKQILILFTFLAFIAKSSSVFIVDEPELSLHPKWQHEFMEYFLKLRPSNTQLLLATHSPDIVGKFKSSCINLRGFNDDK